MTTYMLFGLGKNESEETSMAFFGAKDALNAEQAAQLFKVALVKDPPPKNGFFLVQCDEPNIVMWLVRAPVTAATLPAARRSAMGRGLPLSQAIAPIAHMLST